MAKGFILVDVPENCNKCPLKSQLFDAQYICTVNHKRFCIDTQDKPDWCPIREFPARKEPTKLPFSPGLPWEYTDYEKGWNDCLDYLEGKDGNL